MSITYTSAATGSTFNTVSPITTGSMTLVADTIAVVIAVLTDANPAGTLSITNSGTAMTWNSIADVSASGCRVAAWWAKSAGSENRTASVAWDSGNALEYALYAITLNGAHASTPVPAGKITTGSAASSVSHTITPTATGSALWLVAADANGTGASTMTAGTNCTIDRSSDPDQFSSILLRPTTQPRTDGNAFTLAETHAGSGVNWIAFEVQAASTGPSMGAVMHNRRQQGMS
jgi:hypothetical protein